MLPTKHFLFAVLFTSSAMNAQTTDEVARRSYLQHQLDQIEQLNAPFKLVEKIIDYQRHHSKSDALYKCIAQSIREFHLQEESLDSVLRSLRDSGRSLRLERRYSPYETSFKNLYNSKELIAHIRTTYWFPLFIEKAELTPKEKTEQLNHFIQLKKLEGPGFFSDGLKQAYNALQDRDRKVSTILKLKDPYGNLLESKTLELLDDMRELRTFLKNFIERVNVDQWPAQNLQE
jgi:hypothetical protein